MLYQVILTDTHLEKVRGKLSGHYEVMPYTVGVYVVLHVDEYGRDVIEWNIPGVVNWKSCALAGKHRW